jgi:hypothetical protein
MNEGDSKYSGPGGGSPGSIGGAPPGGAPPGGAHPKQAGGVEAAFRELERAVSLSNAYPSQVTEIPEPGLPRGPDVAGYERTVQGAVRGVLGRLPKEGRDTPEGFVAMLGTKFEAVEKPGHTEYRLVEGASLAGLVERPDDVTVAQERLIRRAEEVRKVVLPLLQELRPLDPSADPENVDATRALVILNVTDLLTELERPQGPRIPLVDTTLRELRKERHGEIESLRRAFGVGGNNEVQTLEEERNEAAFETIKGYLGELAEGFNIYKGQRDRFFGAQLPYLWRSLQAVDEDVDAAEAAMDSVAFTEGDRAIAFVGDRQMTVAEGFDWVRTLVGEQGRAMVDQAGRYGARALAPRLEAVRTQVEAIAGIGAGDDPVTHPIQHPRVQRRLTELLSQLEDAIDIAKKVAVATV